MALRASQSDIITLTRGEPIVFVVRRKRFPIGSEVKLKVVLRSGDGTEYHDEWKGKVICRAPTNQSGSRGCTIRLSPVDCETKDDPACPIVDPPEGVTSATVEVTPDSGGEPIPGTIEEVIVTNP